MKILVRSNGETTSAEIIKNKDGTIYGIEFDFTPPYLWSDLEIWLNDSENGGFLDYAKMNLSRRNKMQFTKG
jgi:hypothetical protein